MRCWQPLPVSICGRAARVTLSAYTLILRLEHVSDYTPFWRRAQIFSGWGFRSSRKSHVPPTGVRSAPEYRHQYGIFVGVGFNVRSVNPDRLGENARSSHFYAGLMSQVGLRITYCFENPVGDFEAVQKIKTNPTKRREIWLNWGISHRRCPNDFERRSRWLQSAH